MRLREIDYERKSLKEIKSHLNEIEKPIVVAQSDLAPQIALNPFTKEEVRFVSRGTRELPLLIRMKEKCERALAKRLARKELVNDLRARASSNERATRSRASQIKTSIPRTDTCPYCNMPIGTRPHLDHIYPVSKGGQSRPSNIVWICAPCNAKKHNMTLTSFCDKHQLDRHAIERRLASLGKEH